MIADDSDEPLGRSPIHVETHWDLEQIFPVQRRFVEHI